MRKQLLTILLLLLLPALAVAQSGDYKKYIDAAQKGDAEAQYEIGYCYYNGKGVTQDKTQAVYWYRKAAEQGYAKAQYEIGFCYMHGGGITKDETQAVYWYRKAADQGYAMAEESLGTAYSLGNGVTKDPFQSFYWHLRAAKQGKVFAQYYTAINYYKGVGCSQDYKQALYWFNIVANNNSGGFLNICAQDMIGVCYEEGKGVDKDYNQAFYWYKKSAEKSSKGMFRLGRCYDYGMGVSKDVDEALHYYRKAVAQNSSFLYGSMTKNELAWVNDRIKTLSSKSGAATQVASNKKATPVQQSQSVQQTSANVDKNIPVSGQSDKNTFAVIIGNEQYKNEANVPYAENDAKVFKEYAQKTLGVPERQIKYIENAGLNDLRIAVRWLKQAMEVCNGQGKAIFYYAGHGIPDEGNKTAYLLPTDGIGGDVESAYSLQRLYGELNKMPAQRTMVFLDACFSGSKREGGMMASARGVAIKVKPMTPQGKVIVFTAAQGDETAYPYKAQQHGMFTYYLLKKLRETQGNVTLGELSNYITSEVKRESFVENNKMQTPTVKASPALQSSWKSLKLK